ncbi:MAG: biopolymer transporter ExbD [Chlorobi bacterium]|nr:biopolymer transporter ExbD [Chlorobiota bacterium]
MSRFKSKKGKDSPVINTSSLPDIIFMLLFFFMVTTVMREVTVMVKQNMPSASEVQKLERKSLVSYIYIGTPKESKLGTNARIQLNDVFANIEDVPLFVAREREARDEADRKLITTSLKVDGETKMGVVTDVKQELRKSNALKINYSTKKVNAGELK